MLQTLNLAARFLNLRLRLFLPRDKGGTLVLTQFDNLGKFANALFERSQLQFVGRSQLFVGRERHFTFRQRRIRRVALLPQIFQLLGERDHLRLRVAFARFEFV